MPAFQFDALLYKQYRQIRNALRGVLRRPEQLITLLVTIGIGVFMLLAIITILFLPPPEDIASTLSTELEGENVTVPIEDIQALFAEQIESLRGAVTLIFLFFASAAAFKTTLLKFTPADVDILFTTPVRLQRILTGRLILNYLRNATTAFLFWGSGVALALRLSGYELLPGGLWGLAALILLFSSIDQGVATIHTATLRRDIGQPQMQRSVWRLWLLRGVLVCVLLLVLLVLVGVLAQLLLGSWLILNGLLAFFGSPVARLLLLPISLTADLLLVPVQITTPPLLAWGILLLLHLLILHQLLRQVLLGGTGALLEPALSPAGKPTSFDEVVQAARFNPLRLFQIIWRGEWAAAVAAQQRIPAALTAYGHGAAAHEWRRVQEFARVPLRNLIAVLLLAGVPLLLYNPTEPYSLARMIAAIFFTTSIATQLFNDTGDHLRYTDIELAAPVRRWHVLWFVQSPRLLIYWIGGALFVVLAGLLTSDTIWHHIPLLILWYPLILLTMLAVRGAVVFFYPAAANLSNAEADPLQALFVTLINTASFGVVALAILIPFGIVSFLVEYFGLPGVLAWLILLGISGTICAVGCWLIILAYRHYEPVE